MDAREHARPGHEGEAQSSRPLRSRGPRGLRWSDSVWLAILAAIGFVQIVRAQWFDAMVFFAAVAVLVADATGALPTISRRRRLATRWIVGGAAVLGAAMCFLPRHGTWMGVAVLLAGGAALVIAWPQPAGAAPAWSTGLRRIAWAWSAILVFGCLWELAQFILGRVAPHLQWFALSDLIDPLVSSVPGRIAFIVAWVAAGAFVLDRGRHA